MTFSSLLHCLDQRAQYLNHPEGWDWVLTDPVVCVFAPALFLLEDAGHITLTDRLREKSKGLFWGTAANYLRQENEFKRYHKKLSDQHINVIPLKGAALQETVYKKIGLRGMCDFDILVQEEDFIQAAQVLIENGLQPKWSYKSEDPFLFRRLPPYLWPGELSFFDGSSLNVDLHRDLVTYHWFKTAYPLDIEGVWEHRIISAEHPKLYPEDSIWNIRLCPTDMLAHMCLHLALHGIQILKNLWDVDLFVRQRPEDWDWRHYLVTAESWGLKSAIYHVFLFCKHIFDTPIPQEVMLALRPSKFDRSQVKKLITPESLLANRPTLGKRYPTLVKFALFENAGVKLQTLRKVLFPDRYLLKQNSTSTSLVDHWSHILKVLRRGD